MLISASDPIGSVLHSALDGLSYRQRIAADNIANADTPGFIATQVGFEDALRAELGDGEFEHGDVGPNTWKSTHAVGANGNNVDLASETLTQIQSTFSYQLLTRAVGDRFQLVSTAIGGM